MKNIRERFNDNAEEFDELVVEMLEENERLKRQINIYEDTLDELSIERP